MRIGCFRFDHVGLLGDSAMHPIAPRLTRHAAFHSLVGTNHCIVSPCLARQSQQTQMHPTVVSRFTRAVDFRVRNQPFLFLPPARLKTSGRKLQVKSRCSPENTCASSY